MLPDSVPLLIIISAPSGAGKTTLCQQLLMARPSLTRAVTCTTRPPRKGERDGTDYHFLEEGEFLRRAAAGEFLERATVYGNNYGTLKEDVLHLLRAGKDVLLSLDVQGAASVRELARTATELKQAIVTVFLAPESLAVLEARLRKRASDAPEIINHRLREARNEMNRASEFDFIIVSSSVEQDLQRMLSIMDAEKMRTARFSQVLPAA